MMRHLVVAGTGKIGLDCGLYFLRRGWRVTWLSGDPARCAEFGRRIGREARRLADGDPGAAGVCAAHVLLIDELSEFAVSAAPDLFLEATREELELKRRIFHRIAPLLPPAIPLATTSSSILPGDIHPRCLGAHCFFPLEMTRLVEVVAPRTTGERDVTALREILHDVGLRTILQGPLNAFTLNRLLLPLQAEAVSTFFAGWSVQVVDRVSGTPLVPFGQLTMMDTVGLDVIAAAVANYRRRLPPEEARDYGQLDNMLQSLLAAGKRGKKNRNGFLAGPSLLGPTRMPPARDVAELTENFRLLAANTCARAIESGDIEAGELGLALSSLFATAIPLEEECRHCREPQQLERLARLRRTSGRSYFRAASLSRLPVAAQ